MITSRIVRFCAEECERQQSGELSVADMVDAWEWARGPMDFGITKWGIIRLGCLVEPEKNANGFRQVPVMFRDGTVRDYHESIPRQIGSLLNASLDRTQITPAEFYQEFQEIHPFVDGNGRVGAILFNVLNGTMDDPVVPPEFRRKS